MNKTVIAAVIVILLLLGGGAFFLSSKSATPSASPTLATQNANVTTETSQKTGTLGSLLSAGQNQECSFSSDSMTQGTVQISGDKMRGSFTTENNQTSDMIRDGEWVYIWSSAMPQGIKTKFDLNASASADANAQKYVNTNQQVKYDCKPWTVDASKFELPTNVTFTDITTQVNQMQNVQIEDSSGMRAEQCKSCNNLNGQAKDYCEKTFCQ